MDAPREERECECELSLGVIEVACVAMAASIVDAQHCLCPARLVLLPRCSAEARDPGVERRAKCTLRRVGTHNCGGVEVGYGSADGSERRCELCGRRSLDRAGAAINGRQHRLLPATADCLLNIVIMPALVISHPREHLRVQDCNHLPRKLQRKGVGGRGREG